MLHFCAYSRGLPKWNSDSMAAWQKLNVEVILISEFMNSGIRTTSSLFCISGSCIWIHESRDKDHFNKEVFIPDWQDGRISLQKTSIFSCCVNKKNTAYQSIVEKSTTSSIWCLVSKIYSNDNLLIFLWRSILIEFSQISVINDCF